MIKNLSQFRNQHASKINLMEKVIQDEICVVVSSLSCHLPEPRKRNLATFLALLAQEM